MRVGSRCLPQVEAALAELEQLEPSTLTEGELHRVVVEFQELAARLASVRARFVAEWDEQGAWSSNGSKQAWGRLARECSLSPTAAKLEVRRAKRLRTMPATAAAFAEGKLSVDQVDLLVGANQPALAAVFERDEQLLRDELVGLRYPEARRFIEYWIDQAYDEIGKDRSRPGEAGRHLYAARTFNGTVDVRAHFDPLAGTEYLSALGCIEHELFEDDWAVARAEHGRDAVPSQLPRTAAQRRADAQIVMARRAQAYRHGKHRLPRPLLTVHVGLDALRRMCELADGTVVSPSQLFPRLAAADIERVVFESPSRVIDVGVRERFFTGALRRAIEIRDRHCQHPSGCDVPGEDCQIDHIEPYGAGGLTVQENGRCYCPRHNRMRIGVHDERPPPDTGSG